MFYAALLLLFSGNLLAQEKPVVIETKTTALVYKAGMQNKLVQAWFGEKLANPADYEMIFGRHEAYVPAGTDNLYEPAVRMLHNDGNPSLALVFEKAEVSRENENVVKTIISLKDEVYPVSVKLCFRAFYNEDIIESWTEISHSEKKPVTLSNFASSMLQFSGREYWLTQFHGDWAKK
jgi:alpha-galactosidase